MDDYTWLGVMICFLCIGAPIAYSLTQAAITNQNLRRMARDGYKVTLGITGNQTDCDMQKEFLQNAYDAVSQVGDRSEVVPFPTRRRRGGETA